MFFKKKIDWSKYTKQPEPTPPTPEPEKSYPYDTLLIRAKGQSSNLNYDVRARVRSAIPDDNSMNVEDMQVALLQDLRDKLDAIISRMDTLVTALNSNIEDDTVKVTDTVKQYLDFIEGLC